MEKKQPDWLSKVTYVDEWGYSSVGKPPDQDEYAVKSKQIIRRFAYFQSAVVVLQLLTPVVDISMWQGTPGGFPILTFIISFYVGPCVLAISVIIELIVLRLAKSSIKKSHQTPPTPESKEPKMDNSPKTDQPPKASKKFLNKVVFEEGSKPDKILTIVTRIQIVILLLPIGGVAIGGPLLAVILFQAAIILLPISIIAELIIIFYFAAYNKLNHKNPKNDGQ